ncbi:CAMKK protein kinase [Exophiala aquamarina CBS 119918]|uniref:non-specific serine/threonine protein kinase n=1 Tax=Exophiala aquamarina CBS 119918 TaxID=1182545 RepID=A0A072PKP4_9EURO|nr:CAMKK protein kinase [Exophiala aquamarina CBS 119918]KEF56095.1 CAMKK protein kinase [Exophiala aquamarina CBS 119918]
MAENTGIRWDPNLQQARRTTETATTLDPLTSAQIYHATVDSARSDGDDILTQRNTPTALSAQRSVDPIDEALCADLDSISHQDSPSPAFAPLRTQQSLPSSAPNSSQSLKALSEREADTSGASVSRALSARSSHGQIRARRTSTHIKSASLSTTKRSVLDRPTYPDQSFAALQSQFYNARPHPPLRARSSHPAQNLLYNDMSNWISQPKDRGSVNQSTKTADNTPMSSPGLFSPSARLPSASSLDDLGPQLHHLQAPKETDFAEIEHDTFSGNKFINNYEVVQELGRGEHGKVKLGRNMETAAMVAIKIVPRYSVKRRLGRLGAPEDRTKREVAILKKARHPNVVSLLEVIDDPNKNKVYLILEYVEKGEIKWRKPGVREVLSVNNARFDQERRGATLSLEPSERDIFHVTQAQRRHEQMDRDRTRNAAFHSVPNWSLEHGDAFEDDDHFLDISRTPSQQFYGSSSNAGPSRTTSHDDHANLGDTALMGSMWGAYDPSDYRDRKFSIAASAASHMSSEFNFEANDELSYVPAMTLEEARRAIRDTLSGLQFLHFIGIIHRDIKPANLLVGSNGTVKISDFGVSYLGRHTTDKDPENHLTEKDVASLDDEKDLARSVGTPAFWAPELCYEDVSMFADNAAPKITGALDLWALGITLYCMVYARLPFYASEGMGLHAAVCTSEVFLPKTRLVPVDTSKDRPSSQVPISINSNKRLDFELKFEEVPEAVRDLIRCLLVKDPAKRMTIDQAKQHAWVTEGMQDPDSWILNTGLEKESKKKILEVDEKEVSHAVGKRNIIERALNTAGRIAGSLLGRTNTRKRAPSAATSTSHSSDSLASPSSGSTVGRFDKEKMREARRSSLRGDEVLTALKTSRENTEHPLAQSQTASPFDHPQEYFSEGLSGQKAASAGCSPTVEKEPRPQAPERGVSTFSNAESVKTIRASQMHRLPSPLPDISQEPDRSVSQERGVRARVDGIWEGTKSLVRIGSRDRRTRSDRSPGASSRNSSECDIQAARGGPSLAISTASAAGAFERPDALRTTMSPVIYNTSAPVPPSTTNAPHKTSFQAPTSTPEAFEHAQEVNQRRMILEAHYQAEAEAEAATRSLSQTSFDDECPPSPDDIAFLKKQRTKLADDPPELSIESAPIQAGPSASTIASSTDGYGASSVSQSMSIPSFGIVSSASSPPGEGFFGPETADAPLDLPLVVKETEPSFMRTADTVTKHGRPMQVATGAALEDRQGPAYDDGNGDCDSDYDDSDEEDMMIMGPSRKKG